MSRRGLCKGRKMLLKKTEKRKKTCFLSFSTNVVRNILEGLIHECCSRNVFLVFTGLQFMVLYFLSVQSILSLTVTQYNREYNHFGVQNVERTDVRSPSQDKKKKLSSEYKTQKLLCIVFEVLSGLESKLGVQGIFCSNLYRNPFRVGFLII